MSFSSDKPGLQADRESIWDFVSIGTDIDFKHNSYLHVIEMSRFERFRAIVFELKRSVFEIQI